MISRIGIAHKRPIHCLEKSYIAVSLKPISGRESGPADEQALDATAVALAKRGLELEAIKHDRVIMSGSPASIERALGLRLGVVQRGNTTRPYIRGGYSAPREIAAMLRKLEVGGEELLGPARSSCRIERGLPEVASPQLRGDGSSAAPFSPSTTSVATRNPPSHGATLDFVLAPPYEQLPLSPMEQIGDAYLSPQQVLRQLWIDHGAREALGMFFELVVPDCIDEGLAELMVAHFVDDELHLPWGVTPWWQPRKLEELPTYTSISPPIQAPELTVPMVAIDTPVQGNPLSTETLQQLYSVLAAKCQSVAEKYAPYFKGHDGPDGSWRPPLLLGVHGLSEEVDPLLSATLREELATAIILLEDVWAGRMLMIPREMIPELQRPLPPRDRPGVPVLLPEDILEIVREHFGAYDNPSPFENPGGNGVSVDILRIIWIRRMAVTLWSDVNEHWPWALEECPLDIIDALLGWNPEDELVMGSKAYFNKYQGSEANPDPFRVGYNGRNGQWVFFREWPDGHVTYYPGRVWSPDPFFEWEVAHSEVKPLLEGMGGVTPDRAMIAVTKYLQDIAYVHDNGMYEGDTEQLSELDVLGPTLKTILAYNYGGCHYTGALVACILRAMNVPCFYMQTPVLNTRSPEKMHLWGIVEAGHTSIVCKHADLSYALFHADDVCCWRGQRYGDPADWWIPYPEWLLVQMFVSEDVDKTNEEGSHLGEAMNMMTAHTYAAAWKQIHGMADAAVTSRFESIDEKLGHDYWMKRILLAVMKVEQNECSATGKCWLDEATDYLANGIGDLEKLTQDFLALGDYHWDKRPYAYIPMDWCPGPTLGIGSRSNISMRAFNLLPYNWNYADSVGDELLLSNDATIQQAVVNFAELLLEDDPSLAVAKEEVREVLTNPEKHFEDYELEAAELRDED